ncbi:MAG TPA: UDP-2,3-diacylglucosamine diphosphatase [Gallionellaceae bacterium]
MRHTLFISDLHLSAYQPQIAQQFVRFIEQTAAQAEALYILGDLFEAWPGDDDLEDPFHGGIVQALNNLSSGGTRIWLMHGNRDLLMGPGMERACGATLLPDPTLIDLYGQPTLISHGDQLCTDDQAYQAYRKQVHDPAWQRQFLAQPLAARKAFIAQLRARSQDEKQEKSSEIMDVNSAAVLGLLREHHYPNLIHGHTHRPGHHVLHVDGSTCERWVLGDWETRANALYCDASGTVKWEIFPA